MGSIVVRYKDADGDKQQISFETIDMTAANFDAQVTAQNDLITALNAVVIGANIGHDRVASRSELSVANPANQFAQTNIQWVLEYEDTVTGLRYTTRVGTANLADASIEYNGAPALDLSAGDGLALKTAFDAIVRHDGNAVDLIAVYFRE